MNKGLEVIEAHHLFGTPYDRIDVVVHPQSIVHALVTPVRRRDARAPRPPRHARPDRLRAAPPRPRRRPRADARPRRGRLAGLRAAGPGHVRLPAPGPRGRRSPAAPRRASSTPPTRSPCTPSSPGRLSFLGIAEVIEATLDAGRRRPRALLRDALRGRRRAPARSPAELVAGARGVIAALLAALGFMALIVLHELGHFVAAKAVGMRVERFALFFPPLIWRKQGKGETEYAIGAIPLGGYVKISGMNPHEELPPEVEHRAYFRQKPWKRIVVILAGPLVNIVLAFVIFAGAVPAQRRARPTAPSVAEVERDQPAEGVLRPGRRDRRASTAAPATATTLSAADRLPPLRGQARPRAARPTTPVDARRSSATARTVTERVTPRLRRRGASGCASASARSAALRDASVGDARPASRWTRCGSSPTTTRRPHRRHLRPREAQGDLAASSAPTRRRARRSSSTSTTALLVLGADLAVAGHRQPVPVPAARRRPRVLGGRGEGPRQGDPVQRHGEVRASSASRS